MFILYNLNSQNFLVGFYEIHFLKFYDFDLTQAFSSNFSMILTKK